MNTKSEQAILKALGNKLMSVNELAQKLEMNRPKLTGYLELMAEQGKLKKSVVGMAHVYSRTGR